MYFSILSFIRRCITYPCNPAAPCIWFQRYTCRRLSYSGPRASKEYMYSPVTAPPCVRNIMS